MFTNYFWAIAIVIFAFGSLMSMFWYDAFTTFKKVGWKNIKGYIAIIAMPLFYSISEGIAFGVISFVFCKLSIIQSPTGIFYPGSHHMCLCDGSFFGYKPAYNTSFSKHANVRRHISSRAPGAVKSWPQPGIMCSSICGY